MFHIYFEAYLRPDKGTGKGKGNSSGSGRGGRSGRGGKGAKGGGSSGSRQRWQDRAGHETGEEHASWGRGGRTHQYIVQEEPPHDETAPDTLTAEEVDPTFGPAVDPTVIPDATAADVIPDATAERSPDVMPDNFNVVGDNFAANPESLCIICNSDFGRSRLVMGRCLHKFHDKCIRDWWRLAAIAPTCPSCRQPAQNYNLIRMQWQPMAATNPAVETEAAAVMEAASAEAPSAEAAGAEATDAEAAGAEATDAETGAAVAAVIEAARAESPADPIVVEDSESTPVNHGEEEAATGGESAAREADPAVASTSSSSRVPKRRTKKTPEVPKTWS